MVRVRSFVRVVVIGLFAAWGCSSGSGGGSTGTGGKDAGLGGSGGTVGGGGTAGGGSGGSAGGAAGSSSGGGGGASGGGGAAGGAAGHDGGIGGSGGATDGGAADGSADGGAGVGLAAALDKFRFECPCKTGAGDHLSNGDCNVTPQTDRQTVTKTMGGDPGIIYDVILHVRGLSEPNTYLNGTLDPNNRFYTGGTATTADNGGYTSYMMTVSNPAQHYFFNYNPSVSHLHFLLDYTVTVKIRGGATVTFDVDGDGSHPDGVEVDNHDHLVVPDVPPAPNWYDGQFIQLDVVSVEPTQ